MTEGRRLVTVTWDEGKLSGDEQLVASLLALSGSGEVVGIDKNGHAIEASLEKPDLALETICYWIGEAVAVDGDLPAGVKLEEHLDEA